MTAATIELSVLRLAGFIGVDPNPFSFRQLFVMAEGRRAEEWAWWSELLALMANCNRTRKGSKAFSADEIHPYRKKKRERSPIGDTIATLKAHYTKGK